MTEPGYLEEGLASLDEMEAELGGFTLDLQAPGDSEAIVGVDDPGEVEDDEQEGAGDGTVAGHQRLASRAIQVIHRPDAGTSEDLDTRAATFADSLNELRKVMSPLPDRTQTRLFRWRLYGEPAKRIAVRPAKGQPMSVPANWRRLVQSHADVLLRLDAPDPVILSDEYHEHIFEAGETYTVVNAGSFTATLPCAWWLEADGDVAIENLDYGEYVRFTDGPLTVARDREIVGATSFGKCFGPDGSYFPRWPLLRPGNNTIRASAACTFRWRDTY